MNFKKFYKIYKEKAYHGSSEKIKGAFSYDKIGSGHGAQAFGYGFYFSEVEQIASGYVAQSFKERYEYNGKDANYWYDFFLNKRDYLKAEIWESIMLHKSRNYIRGLLLDSEAPKEDFDYLKSLPNDLFAPPAGGLYEVELDTTLEELIDWQKTFEHQSDFVKDKLNTLKDHIEAGYVYIRSGVFNLESMFGSEIYQALVESFSVLEPFGGLERSKYHVSVRKDKNTSLLLRSLGIKGIAYNAYNNSSLTKKPLKNIVMFSPNDIKIIKEKHS